MVHSVYVGESKSGPSGQQVEDTKVQKLTYRTEVWKPKCGSMEKTSISVFSVLLTYDCVCQGLLDKR